MNDLGYYDPPSKEGNIDYIKVIENNKVVEKSYCVRCGSLNIKVSKKGNRYCGEICWEKEN